MARPRNDVSYNVADVDGIIGKYCLSKVKIFSNLFRTNKDNLKDCFSSSFISPTPETPPGIFPKSGRPPHRSSRHRLVHACQLEAPGKRKNRFPAAGRYAGWDCLDPTS